MIDIIIGIVVGLMVVLFLSPYMSLWNLNGINDELRKIREQLEKMERKQDDTEIH